MASNGNLPASDLAPIAGGRLARGPAAAWNAMNVEARRLGVELRPTGSRSSYRPYPDQQYLWNEYRAGRGNLAAKPGTSNHGMGTAVDLATPQMRSMVDRIGERFGWAKKWSDAPSEWWHLAHRSGVWSGKDPGPNGAGTAAPTRPAGVPKLHIDYFDQGHNARHADVKVWQEQMAQRGWQISTDGIYGPGSEKVCRSFQSEKGLGADGKVGPTTWAAAWTAEVQ
jgi:peptidoglycan hydrolase-like protein with peptidoglycan-binding domain